MKRIGILTFHRSINYGAYLQSYALSNEIKNRYPEAQVEIIDLEMKTKHENYRKNFRISPFMFEYIIKYWAFQKDLRKLSLSDRTFITNYFNEFKEYLRQKYDILVVGSDAVWNYEKKQPGHPYWDGDVELENPYWLFGKDLKDIVKMSYAASAYKTDFQNISEEKKSFFAEMISDFQYIGIRDQETLNFVRSFAPDKELHRNCDPTILLAKNQDYKLSGKVLRKNFINTGKKIASFMTADMPYLDEIKNHLGKKYTCIHFNHRDRNRDVIKANSRLMINMSPLEWYAVYNRVEINFSHYFHGTLVGLRNSVPTISVDKTNFPYPYVGKNEQAMTDTGLSDYLFFQKTLNSKEEKDRLFAQIDIILRNRDEVVEKIESGLAKEKERSETFFAALGSFL